MDPINKGVELMLRGKAKPTTEKVVFSFIKSFSLRKTKYKITLEIVRDK